MKYSLVSIAAAGVLSIATSAQANNAAVEDALKSHADLSIFYQGLVSTGVAAELKEGQSYTVFAPTNDAFAKLPKSKYPCFYSAECKAQVAAVMRKHIVPGNKPLSDIVTMGSDSSLFSIDNQQIVASEPNKDSYTADGSSVLSKDVVKDGLLYRINGVLISERDLVQFEAPTVIAAPASATPAPAPVEPKVVTTVTTDATTPIPY